MLEVRCIKDMSMLGMGNLSLRRGAYLLASRVTPLERVILVVKVGLHLNRNVQVLSKPHRAWT
jgi:hypothetical protein